MKRSLLIGLLLVGTTYSLFAQPERMPFGEKSSYSITNPKKKTSDNFIKNSKSILFYDDFEGIAYDFSKWEILRSDSIDFKRTYPATGTVWFQCSLSSFYGNGITYIKNGHNSAAITYTADDITWLLSKDTITLPTDKPLNLAFWLWYFYSTDYPTHFHVIAYNTETQVTDTIRSWGTTPENSISNQYKQRIILNLEKYAGAKIRIGLLYDNFNLNLRGNQLAIDDIYLVDQEFYELENKALPFDYTSVPLFLVDSVELGFKTNIINNGIEYPDTIKLEVVADDQIFRDTFEITDTLALGETRSVAFKNKHYIKNIGEHYYIHRLDTDNEFYIENNYDTVYINVVESIFAKDNGVIGGFSLGKDQEFGNIYKIPVDAFIGGVQIEWPPFNNTKEFTPFEFKVTIYELNPTDNSIKRIVYTDYFTKTAESSDVFVNYQLEEPVFCTRGFSYMVTVKQLGNEPLGIGYDGNAMGSFWKLNQSSWSIQPMANPTIGNVALRLTMTEPEENPLVTFTIKNKDNEGVRNVKIYIPELDSTLNTNSSGVATIDLENGFYSYKIDTVGFAKIEDEFRVFSQDKFINLELTKPYWAKFLVTDQNSAPISGAEIIVDGNPLKTNANGVDSILLAPDSYSYYIMASGFEKYDWGFLEHEEKDTLITTMLNTATTHNLTVKVINEQNQVLPNSEVSIMGYGWKYTDTEGQTTFTGISDTDISVFASSKKYWPNIVNIQLEKDSTIELKLLADRYNVTFFVSSKGNPIVDAEIIIVGIDTVKTGITGYAVADFIPFGNDIPYRVKYNGYQTYNGTFDIEDMDIRVDISLIPTSVEPNTAYSLNIYPNPNTGDFTISNQGKYSIMIFDITGRLVYNNSLAFDNTPVSLSGNPNGIYIVKIATEKGIITKRIIKQ